MPTINPNPNETWAIVELMGHAMTAGRIHKPSEWGGLIQVDVPTKETEGGFYTEFYSANAIYSIKVTSEEIARAHAGERRIISAYDAPVVMRSQFEATQSRHERTERELRDEIEELRRRLTSVNALPAPAVDTSTRDEDEEDEQSDE